MHVAMFDMSIGMDHVLNESQMAHVAYHPWYSSSDCQVVLTIVVCMIIISQRCYTDVFTWTFPVDFDHGNGQK
jgi:hypothetical protein